MMSGHKVRTFAVPLGDMVNDARVQRGLDHTRVASIVRNYNQDAIGVLTLSARDSGAFSIIDGQHRYHAMKEMGLAEDWKQTSRVFYGLSMAQEAELFRLLNNTKKPTALDLFRVRVIEGDEVAIGITDMLARHGWVVSQQLQSGHLRAIATLEKLWRRDPLAAELVITVLSHTWGEDHHPDYVDGRLIDGYGILYARHGEKIDTKTLMHKVSRAFSPIQIYGKGSALKKIHSSSKRSVGAYVADILENIYDTGIRTESKRLRKDEAE